MLKKDYKKLYQLQDKVFNILQTEISCFYLTGGTALGRFYLNHRFSEDMDFFMNQDKTFHQQIAAVEKAIITNFNLLQEGTLKSDDFIRFTIEENNIILKIEFVNDVSYRCGEPLSYKYGLIDTPQNILANKLTAILSREEPKDMFDIISISCQYRFNWIEVFGHAKKKAIINELDVSERIFSFPSEWLENVEWLQTPVDITVIEQRLKTIANDFIAGADNSLCKNGIFIEKAQVIL